MRCPFCESKPGFNLFGASYYCQKTGEDISDGSELYKQYCNGYDTAYSKCPNFAPKSSSSDSGCFLTSACTEALGLDDDCMELSTLRSFRDNWLANQPDGKEEIEKYYQIAPPIVQNIRMHSNCTQIFRSIYDELVVPCVHLIEDGRYEDAHILYRKKTVELMNAYT